MGNVGLDVVVAVLEPHDETDVRGERLLLRSERPDSRFTAAACHYLNDDPS